MLIRTQCNNIRSALFLVPICQGSYHEGQGMIELQYAHIKR
jgi:hypothetical protein